MREGKFQSEELRPHIQEDFCIFSHAAHTQHTIDYQRVVVRLSDFNIFLTIRCAPPCLSTPLFYPSALSLELIFTPDCPHSYPDLRQPYSEGPQ